ncbi:MAG: hypothetical protein H7X97_08860 [Opitutaceae bacterium]|nr:hypothetical protein [Verrucomicrobiales bacterium]
MNDQTPSAPPVIPANPIPTMTSPPPMIGNLLAAIESIVRNPDHLPYHLGRVGLGRMLGWLLAIVVGGGLLYGVITGTFSRGDQLWAAPLKIVGGLLFAGAICLPSLYVLSCLSGSRGTLGEVTGVLCGLLALTMVLLLSFAPVVWVFSQSTESLVAMGVLHLVLWFVATAFGLRLLQRCFDQYAARSSGGLLCWTAIFLLVVLQMTTALRPIIGRSDSLLPKEKRFFLHHWSDCIDGKYSLKTDAETNSR